MRYPSALSRRSIERTVVGLLALLALADLSATASAQVPRRQQRPKTIEPRATATRGRRPASTLGQPVTAASLLLAASFDWSMEPRFGLDANNNGRMDLPNTPQYVHNLPQGSSVPAGYLPTFSVTLDGTGSRSATGPITSYQWTLSGGTLHQPLMSTAARWTATLAEGVYQVSLTVTDGTHASETTTKTVPVEDLLIVSIGDSYSSGEGNPERRRGQTARSPVFDPGGTGVVWADDGTANGSSSVAADHYRSHRTTVGWPAQVALALERADRHTSVTFISVAASGAGVDVGLLHPYAGVDNEPLSKSLAPMPPQITQVRGLVGARRIDALLISIGANDVGLSRVASGLVAAVTSGQAADVFSNYMNGSWPAKAGPAIPGPRGLYRLFPVLADSIQRLDPFNTYIIDYADPSGRLDNGRLIWCDEILDDFRSHFSIDVDEQQTAMGSVIEPLSRGIAGVATKYGWQFVPVMGEFGNGHGYCAAWPSYSSAPDAYYYYVGNTYPADLPRPTDPQLSWFRTASQARVLQGPLSDTTVYGLTFEGVHTKGTGHPNEFGHQAIRDAVLGSLYLPVQVPNVPGDWDGTIADAVEVHRQSNGILKEVKTGNRGQRVEVPFYETITPATDVDMFKVEVTRSEQLEIRGVTFDGPTAVVRAFASDGRELHSRRLSAAGPEPCRGVCTTTFTVADAGPVYLGVSAASNNRYDAVTGAGRENGRERFSYELRLLHVSGQPDNTMVSATNATRGGTFAGFAIEAPDDVDMFRYDGVVGETVTFTVDVPIGSGLQPSMRLFDPGGTEISSDARTIRYTFAVASAVYIGVSSSNTTYDPRVGVAQASTAIPTGVVAGRRAGTSLRSGFTTGPYQLSIAKQ